MRHKNLETSLTQLTFQTKNNEVEKGSYSRNLTMNLVHFYCCIERKISDFYDSL